MITVVCNPRCEFGACVANDTCKCSQGYTGKSCSEKGLVHYTPTHSGSPHLLLCFFHSVVVACEKNICENGGTCSRHVNDYTCECPPGYSGFTCEENGIRNVAVFTNMSFYLL